MTERVINIYISIYLPLTIIHPMVLVYREIFKLYTFTCSCCDRSFWQELESSSYHLVVIGGLKLNIKFYDHIFKRVKRNTTQSYGLYCFTKVYNHSPFHLLTQNLCDLPWSYKNKNKKVRVYNDYLIFYYLLNNAH